MYVLPSNPLSLCRPPARHPPSPCFLLFCTNYSSLLFLHFLFLFSFISVLFSGELQDIVVIHAGYLTPSPPSSTNTSPSNPSFCIYFLSQVLSLPIPIHCSLPLSVSPVPTVTLLLAECSFGNGHLGRRISVSPLACWDRFSKNTAKHVWLAIHTLSSVSFLCMCVFVHIEVSIPDVLAC